MGLEENARREVDDRIRISEERLREALRAELGREQRSFRGEVRVLIVLSVAANTFLSNAEVGIEVAGVTAALLAAMRYVPRFLNR